MKLSIRLFFILYSLGLLYLMFFGFGRTQMPHNIVRLSPFLSTLKFMQNSFSDWMTLVNLFGNILVFIPFGFLGLVDEKYKDLKTLMIHFLSVLIIVEFLQYFTRLGVFDIDDLLLNTLGLIFGFFIFKLTLKIYDKNHKF